MQTIKLLTFALLMVALAITGCKKDETLKPQDRADALKSKKTTEQLLAFREQLKLKNGSSLSVDSATWYLEGLLNYENANNDHNITELTFNHDTLVMCCVGSTISIDELNIVYSYFTNELYEVLTGHNDTTYQFDLIDINISYSGLKSGETVITMVAASGLQFIGNYVAFEPYDYWFWGANLGKCGSYIGNNVGTDAADKLQIRFNNPLNPYEPGYFTSVEERQAWPYETEYLDPNYPGSFIPSMIFWASGSGSNPPSEPCLSPLELNYYLSKFEFIKNNCKPNGKTFKNVEVNGTFGLQINTWERIHYYTLYYGIFNQYN